MALPYAPSNRDEWDSFVRSSKNGTFLFERAFMEYHAHRISDASLMVRDGNGDLHALFPANREAAIVHSHAGLGLGGVITNARMTVTRMLDVFDAIVRALRQAKVKRLEYKTIPFIYHRHPAEEDRYALFLLGAQLSRRDVIAVVSNARPLAFRKGRISDRNKAIKRGLQVELANELDGFWEILSAHLQSKYQVSPVHSLEEMSRLRANFPEIIQNYIVRVDGVVAAGCLVYATDQLAHVQYIASTDAGRESGALDLMFAYLIKERFAHLPYFDFGGCNLNGGLFLNRGLAEFKEGFGARAVAHDFYTLDVDQTNLGSLLADRV